MCANGAPPGYFKSRCSTCDETADGGEGSGWCQCWKLPGIIPPDFPGGTGYINPHDVNPHDGTKGTWHDGCGCGALLCECGRGHSAAKPEGTEYTTGCRHTGIGSPAPPPPSPPPSPPPPSPPPPSPPPAPPPSAPPANDITVATDRWTAGNDIDWADGVTLKWVLETFARGDAPSGTLTFSWQSSDPSSTGSFDPDQDTTTGRVYWKSIAYYDATVNTGTNGYNRVYYGGEGVAADIDVSGESTGAILETYRVSLHFLPEGTYLDQFGGGALLRSPPPPSPEGLWSKRTGRLILSSQSTAACSRSSSSHATKTTFTTAQLPITSQRLPPQSPLPTLRIRRCPTAPVHAAHSPSQN